jgi:hypothetical protein
LPQPTPTYDPGIPEWTVLIYVAADNGYSHSALEAIDRMELAGETKQVNVIVQVDFSPDGAGEGLGEARRYRIRGDDEPGVIASEPLELLAEVNMGDPGVLAEFLKWGIAHYPANRYALLFWGGGASWHALALDEDVGFAGEADLLTLPDLRQALADGLAQPGLDKLDLIGFDASFTSQLDLYRAVQPYADFAVASASLLSSRGWDYRALLTQLYDDPNQDGRALAQQSVTTVGEYQRRQGPIGTYAVVAADLASLPELTHWVEQLAIALAAAPDELKAATAGARGRALDYARIFADQADQIALIDLGHFAANLAQRAQDERLIPVAQEVVDAVDSVVIAIQTAPLFEGAAGVAVYFPRESQFYAFQHEQVESLPAWETFLNSYHALNWDEHPPPQINFSNILSQAVGAQNPAYLEIELIGRDIEHVALVAGRHEPDGRDRLLVYRPLAPEAGPMPVDERNSWWRDGLHEQYAVWFTDASYLSDAAGNGDNVLLWPTYDGSPLMAIQGQFRRAEGQATIEASLTYDAERDQLTALWALPEAAAFELRPEKGDEFQLYKHYRLPDGNIVRESGATLIFDESRRLYVGSQILPDGEYFTGIIAESIPGGTAAQFTPLSVNNASNRPGYGVYFDPAHGFQFLYPHSWRLPAYDQGVLTSANLSGTTQMQVAIFPDLRRGADDNTLAREALGQLGAVDLLFPTESIIIAETRGQRTVYGYEKSGQGPRTGILLAFVKDGVGFVVDIDGPQADESGTLATANDLAANWTSRPARFGQQAGEWAKTLLDSPGDITLAHPADFVYQTVNNWHRFSRDRTTFAAFRSQAAGPDASEVIATLVRDAGSGVDGFAVGQNTLFLLSGAVWLRSDFTYSASNGNEIQGFVMVRSEQGTETAVWVEAPTLAFDRLESNVFLLMIADLTARN